MGERQYIDEHRNYQKETKPNQTKRDGFPLSSVSLLASRGEVEEKNGGGGGAYPRRGGCGLLTSGWEGAWWAHGRWRGSGHEAPARSDQLPAPHWLDPSVGPAWRWVEEERLLEVERWSTGGGRVDSALLWWSGGGARHVTASSKWARAGRLAVCRLRSSSLSPTSTEATATRLGFVG